MTLFLVEEERCHGGGGASGGFQCPGVEAVFPVGFGAQKTVVCDPQELIRVCASVGALARQPTR